MNDTIRLAPEVDAFVAAVRARFNDLDADEREDLLDGLEADMSDLVAERGPEALGDPGAYAEELRAAAGLPPAGPAVRDRLPVGARVDGVLDSARTRWGGLVADLPGDPWGLLQSVRPVWWVARAWIALQTVDLIFGTGAINYGLSPVPSLVGWGLPLLVVAILGSVQMGRGRVWPGTASRGVVARVLLLVLNAFAIAMVPVTVTSVLTPAKIELWGVTDQTEQLVNPGVITYQDLQVCTLRVVDKEGKRVEGLRVLDATSNRLLPMNNNGC